MTTDKTTGLETEYDLLVRGGTVLDGTGSSPFRADIGVRGEKIVAVGDLSQARGGRELDATGLRIAPGFIDIHTHSDISALYDPGQASAVSMGVTTQVVGNCGLALGFATASDVFAFEKRWLAAHRAKITWDTFDGFLRLVDSSGIATNVIPLAGHGTLRKRVMGMVERPPSAQDMQAMQHELDAALEAGAWGFSSGLEYPPSSYADEDELTELCRVVSARGGIYATHLRSESDGLVESVQEAINVAERANLPLQLSHHKAEGKANWGKVAITLGMVEAARSRGLDVQMDQYPYTAFMTGLAIQVLPRWALSGTAEETMARLQDPAQRATIVQEMRQAHPDWKGLDENSSWHNIQIGVCRNRPQIQGKTVAALALEAGEDPIEYVVDLLAETDGFISAVNFAIGEPDIASVMRYPWTAIGSDGVGTHPDGTAGQDQIHPRAYGTFTRILGHYVRELGILTEAEAIYKMTGLPAARLGLQDRGKIAPDTFADITIYDPARVGDCATFDAPHQFSIGIAAVLVNGRFVWNQGEVPGIYPGHVLRQV